ncbi:related to ADH6 - NADPH-dependent alcohol dehydrogenase [Ustilago sp. UG-2017a]|nr:related to ADH6 - NADPH-dependent alcohol dehydrogenase [Ustilago sp. UG-2017a]
MKPDSKKTDFSVASASLSLKLDTRSSVPSRVLARKSRASRSATVSALVLNPTLTRSASLAKLARSHGKTMALLTDGSGFSMGEYAKYSRASAHFAVHIPESLPSTVAAPLMCGGITVYNPLKFNGCGTEGFKRVGVVGIGGLGHFALIFAKALGAQKITAISHTHSKEGLTRKLGARSTFSSSKKLLRLVGCEKF